MSELLYELWHFVILALFVLMCKIDSVGFWNRQLERSFVWYFTLYGEIR